MTKLDEIRDFHDDSDHFETIHIRGNLFDVGVYAIIERYYARFLKAQIEYFPYMLKSQWREFWGRSRSSSHQSMQKLIDMKVLGEGQFRGCHYVFPATRAMKWFYDDPNALPMRPRPSDAYLIECFMRAEYFLQEEMPLYVTADEAFHSLEKALKSMPQNVISGYLPPISFFNVEHIIRDYRDRITVQEVKTTLDVLELAKQTLNLLTKRGCYIKSVDITRENEFRIEVAVIHVPQSSALRYHRLIQEISTVCECFCRNTFALYVLADSEKETKKAYALLQDVWKKRNSRKLLNRCDGFLVKNTNITRYYQSAGDDVSIGNLEDVIREWT